jgi:hypothetical protein
MYGEKGPAEKWLKSRSSSSQTAGQFPKILSEARRRAGAGFALPQQAAGCVSRIRARLAGAALWDCGYLSYSAIRSSAPPIDTCSTAAPQKCRKF